MTQEEIIEQIYQKTLNISLGTRLEQIKAYIELWEKLKQQSAAKEIKEN